jgi:uncharacterized protein (DUF924 family)
VPDEPKKDEQKKEPEPPQQRRSTGPPRGERVTLTFAGPPLSLPGEAPSHTATSGTFELELGEEVALPGRPEQPPPPTREAADAWTRDRRSRGSGLHPAAVPTPVVPIGVWSERPASDRPASGTPPTPLESPLQETPGFSGADALNLVARTRVPKVTIDLVAEMRDRFALGDFTGCLRVAELLIGRRPDLEEAARTRDAARQRLEELYRSRMGGNVFVVAVPEAEVRWLGIDSSATHVLSCIDGRRRARRCTLSVRGCTLSVRRRIDRVASACVHGGMSDRTPEDVLSFWFGTLDADGFATEEQSKKWFTKSDELDAEIARRFRADYDAIVAGEREGWLDAPRSSLAYVIVLDQFARNMFRGTPEAFEADPQALEAAQSSIDLGFDRELRPAERVFLYMPFMHAENLAAQDRCIDLFEGCAAELPESVRGRVLGNVKYARAHRDIVARFGRFPHRNTILGRTPTPEEIEFLKQPGSSF